MPAERERWFAPRHGAARRALEPIWASHGDDEWLRYTCLECGTGVPTFAAFLAHRDACRNAPPARAARGAVEVLAHE